MIHEIQSEVKIDLFDWIWNYLYNDFFVKRFVLEMQVAFQRLVLIKMYYYQH